MKRSWDRQLKTPATPHSRFTDGEKATLPIVSLRHLKTLKTLLCAKIINAAFGLYKFANVYPFDLYEIY